MTPYNLYQGATFVVGKGSTKSTYTVLWLGESQVEFTDTLSNTPRMMSISAFLVFLEQVKATQL